MIIILFVFIGTFSGELEHSEILTNLTNTYANILTNEVCMYICMRVYMCSYGNVFVVISLIYLYVYVDDE